MSHSEEQARNAVCPLRTGFCCASECMMWRWEPIAGPESGDRRFRRAENHDAYTEDEAGPRPTWCDGWEFCPCDLDPAGWIEPQEEAAKRMRGYCGLAGKPWSAA